MSVLPRSEPLLEVKGLKKHFDVTKGWVAKKRKILRAVDDVSFQVFRGETFGIVGESGCGKSTTGNVVLRLIEATDGEIRFEGEDIRKLPPARLREKRRDFQMIFQDPFSSLNPRLRVGEIIAEPLRSHDLMEGGRLNARVAELMEIVGLSRTFVGRYPHEFSGGQRQRIGIARALALQPKLIVCDEAVSALDVSIQSQILNLLSDLQKEFDLTYIFIGHGLPAVKHISDRIAVMYLGKIVEIGAKETLFRSPRHPYTAGLLSSIPIPDPSLRQERRRIILEGDIPSPTNPPAGCKFHTRCPFAQERCKVEEPPLQGEQMSGHLAACHYPLP
ncbi:oligopeptide/dipeptide ABC transporter ATP-binding protein [Paenibacillus sp.]|uniref:ABC transporter ATP-binding protein n=1 Tax=Paenibacillus sp. TaxID=58172 RepID=UPI002D3D0987|nr:oligopeptide/dipeptide ABC transporter ATP-binding protein [Paenibacillus sp.]HZG87443.1 oligopeptide/dipeptide ABC transporter ATP-binding protein [Paenibacillus sp.]